VSASPAGGGSGVQLTYDALDRLSTVTGPTGAVRQFRYDGDQLLAEYDGSGNVVRQYVWGPKTDEPLMWFEGNEGRWLTSDERGSVTAVIRGDGAVLGVNTYDEYGMSGPGNIGSLTYTGQLWLTELGLYHYKARAYSPTLGKFLQPDPIGLSAGTNLYDYVNDDPLNESDSTGRCAEDACIVEGSAALAALGTYIVCRAFCPQVSDNIGHLAERIQDSIFHNEAGPKADGPRINPDKQGKHQPEHKNFMPGKGELTHEDPQGLVDEHAGTGEQVGPRVPGEPGYKERVDFGEPIGVHVDGGTGERTGTSLGIIHHGSDDVHIVPAKPRQNHVG